MPNDTKETVTLKLPSGENVDFVVPGGLSDSDVKNYVLSKRPDLFKTPEQNAPDANAQARQRLQELVKSGPQSNLDNILTGPPLMGAESGLPTPAQVPENAKAMGVGALAGSAIVNPLGTLAAVGGGYAGGKAGRFAGEKGSAALGASPETQATAGNVGEFGGTVLGGAGAMKGAGMIESPATLRASAGGTLGNLKQAAGNIPVNTSRLGDTALEIMTQTGRGAKSVPAVNKLISRITKPGSEPLTYAEAKDFQSNITNLLKAAPGDAGSPLKNPNTFRLVGELNSKLKTALEDASQLSGAPEGTFTDAMHKYSQASSRQQMIDRLHELATKGIKVGAGTAIGGASAGLGYDLYKLIKGDSGGKK